MTNVVRSRITASWLSLQQNRRNGERSARSARWLLSVCVGLLLSSGAFAQTPNPNFNVTVNVGPSAPNNNTVFPGEATSVRVALANNSTTGSITGVNFSNLLPSNAVNSLLVNGGSLLNGPGCSGGTLTTTPGQPNVVLSGLTILPRNGSPGSGECYLDIPIVANSINGTSGSLAYTVGAGDVLADGNTTNATGGPQAYTVRGVQRPTWVKDLDNEIVTLGGANRTLTIRVTNPDGNVALTGVSFTDPMPVSGLAGAIIEPIPGTQSITCVPAVAPIGTVTPTTGITASLAVSGLTVPTNSSCTVAVSVRARHTDGEYEAGATISGGIRNVIPVNGFSSDAGLRPAADTSHRVRARSPLAVSKSFTPNVVAAGEQSLFVITITNSGSTPLTGAGFTDNPIGAPTPALAGLNIAFVADITNSCGGTTTLLSSGAGFSSTGFTIPPRVGNTNGTCTVSVDYTGLLENSDTPTTFTNRLLEGAVTTSDPAIVSQARTATVQVFDRLRVLKSRSPSNAGPGDAVRYTVTIQNFSSTAISNVDVTDNLQNGSTLLLNSPFAPTLSAGCGVLGLNGAAQGNSSVMFTLPTLPARSAMSNSPGQCQISFSAMIATNATSSTGNSIAVGGVCYGTTPRICNGLGSGNVNTSVLGTMELQKTINGSNNASETEGTPTRLRLRVLNDSTAPLTNLTLSDTLPTAGAFQQLRVANPPNISNDCGGTVVAVGNDTSVALNGGSVAARVGNTSGVCTLEVDIVGPAGVYPNTADAAAVRTNADGSITSPIQASDSATITYTDALVSEKFFTPTTAGDGGRSTATIRFTNLDPNRPITGISMTDDLPADMLVAEAASAYSTCSGPVSITATDGAPSISLSGATLAPSGVCELVFDVSVTGSTDWVNVIPAGGITADGSLSNRADISATLVNVPPEVPLISKGIVPGIIAPGQSALLTITITNSDQDLTNLALTDYFTEDGLSSGALNGMSIAPAPEATTDCLNGVVAASPGGTTVRLSGASLSANDSCVVQIRVTSTTVATITNTIPMNSIVSDEGATNSTSEAQSTLATTSDVGISKQFDPAVVSPTEISRLIITLFNAQENELTDLSLTDDFPSGLELAATPNEFSDCGGGVSLSFPNTSSIQMDGGSLGGAIGTEASSCVIEVDVVSAIEGTYVNTIAGDTLTSGINIVPHPPTDATLEVRERLIVNKAFDDLTLDPNDPFAFTTGTAVRLPGAPAPLSIRIENPNSIALTEVTFTDKLPEGVVLADPTTLTTDCTDGSVTGDPNGREIRLTGATLAAAGDAGDICFVAATIVSNIPGIYTNEIAIGDVVSFEGIENDPGTQAQIIIAEPPGISKDFTPPVIAPGVSSTLTIVIENDNDLEMTLTADLVDNLPASPGQMTVANPSVVTTTCPDDVGIVTAAADATSVTIANGAAVPPGGCVVTVDVTASIAGDYLNFIPLAALNTNFGVNEQPAEAPLVVSTLGYISGRVFLDNQTVPDGMYIPGDSTPIAGNIIELRSGTDCTGPILDTMPTDASGYYLFTDLPAETYSVCQPTQPTNTLNSFTTEGTIVSVGASGGTPGTASNPGTPTSQIASIVLTMNGGNADEVSGSPNNDFSEVLPVSIAGNVFYDASDDGVFNPDESGIGGVTITLTGPVTVMALTNPYGSYSFTDLPPGEYTVTETQPGAYMDGQDALGTVDGTPRGDGSVNDVFSTITLAPGEDGIVYDFGEVLSSTIPLVVETTASCSNDAAVVSYNLPAFTGPGAGSAPPITISWRTESSRLAEQLSDQPANGTLLWPGAILDGMGVGIGWPGWSFPDDRWVPVADDRIPEMTLQFTAGASMGSILLRYPPNQSGCLTQPPGTAIRYIPIPTLPHALLWLMALLLSVQGARRLR